MLRNIKLGQPLTPEKNYLYDRIDLFERVCVLIAAEYWKKIGSDNEKRAEVLLDIAYKHLLAKRWNIAEGLSYFLLKDKSIGEMSQMIGQMNYWLCKKRQGNWEQVKNEVDKADFSARPLILQLTLASLLDNADKFYTLLPKAIQSEELNAEHVQTFPIFEEMRQDERFSAYSDQSQEKNPSPLPPSIEDHKKEDITEYDLNNDE